MSEVTNNAPLTEEEQRLANVVEFEELLKSVKRVDTSKLLKSYIQKSDFYTAPASTRYHNAKRGGLLEHSLNVYHIMHEKLTNKSTVLGGCDPTVTEDSIILTSLLHDLGKARFYKETTKNQKTYDKDKVAAAEKWQVKHDNQGDFIWETVPFYEVDDQFPLEHAAKAIYIAAYCDVKLLPAEACAINWHMGFSSCTEPGARATLSNALRMFPALVNAIMEADMEATYILEKEPE